MDIHDIALTLYTALVGKHGAEGGSEEARVALGRDAYRYAEAFVAAKDAWIREQPVPEVDPGF